MELPVRAGRYAHLDLDHRSDGSKLDGGYDFTDAYNGGTSIQFYGDLDANKANDIMLYSTDVAVTDGMTLSLTAKNDDARPGGCHYAMTALPAMRNAKQSLTI